MSSKPNRHPKVIAFLGATGGCTLAALTHTLLSTSNPTHNRNYHCLALARNPSKLTSLLLSQQGITPTILSNHLTIIEGHALDKSALKRLLTANSTNGSITVSTIISGLGATPKLQWSVRTPVTLDQPTVCQDAARALVAALQELDAEGKLGLGQEKKRPLLTFISTTGVSRGKEDVGFWFRWLYHSLLKVPHGDKRGMEEVFRGAVVVNGDDGGMGEKVLRGVVGVRPSLLTGSGDVKEELGVEKVKVGREAEPAVGYCIRRADVGGWVFREVIERGGKGRVGEMVTLTY